MLKNSEMIGQNPIMRPFSDLTKDFDPERRERIEQRKAELRHAVEQSDNRHFQQVAPPLNCHRNGFHHA